MSPASVPDLVGRTLGGRYRLERRLGQGGMGAVYEATQLDLGRSVAVKVLLAATPDAARRLRLEALAAARLRSPHVVAVFDFQCLPGEPPILVMERLEGCSLGAALEHGGPMPVARAVRIALQVLAGLEVAHEAGVLHRDVKPSNVWLAPGNDAVGPELVKVLDFGIARFDHEDRIATTTGTVMGSPGWIAPESLRGLPPDARSDLHAVGLLLFLMLTGCLPWQPTTSRSVHLEVLERVPPFLDTIVTGVPAALAGVVARLLAKDPNARPGTAAEAAAELAPFAREPEAPRHVILGSTAPRPTGSGLFALGLLVPLVVAGAFAAGLLVSRRASIPSGSPAPLASAEPPPSAAPAARSDEAADPSAASSARRLARPPPAARPRPAPSGSARRPSSSPPTHTPLCSCLASDGARVCDPPTDGPLCACETARRERLCQKPLGYAGFCDSSARAVPAPAKLVVGSNDQGIACEGWVRAPSGESVKSRGTVHCEWCYEPIAAGLTAGAACRGVTRAGVAREGLVSCQ